MKNILKTCLCFSIVFGIGVNIFLPNPYLTNSFLPQDVQVINDHYDIEETALVSKDNKKAVVLDWDNSVNGAWECFSETKIFDFLSKKTFVVQRTGGTFHADIEPSSPFDTKTLNEVLKKHTKTRIPVLANINGMWVCASMATRVHGFGLISNNELDGHLCLYFSGSKTSLNKADPLHQKAVYSALELSKKIFPKN
ncbi:MAG: hypothetical protein IJF22_01920 [Clostridia bacterium]|nr:hypothetical protein [Clostridia bacterium]